MSLPRRCLAGISITITAIAAPVLACAQDHRPDAEAYPCASPAKLVIRQDGPSFSISRLDPAIPQQVDPKFKTPAQVAIGTALRIDRTVFQTSLTHQLEISNAHR